MRKLSLVLLGGVSGAMLTLLVLQPGLGTGAAVGAEAARAGPSSYRELQRFGDIFDLVRANYVDKPDSAKLIRGAIDGMVSSLDPHSAYMDATAFRAMQEETAGEFGGVGIEVLMEGGDVKVVAPIDGTPAAKAGLQANDLITDVDGAPVKGLTLTEVVQKMRGTPGSNIRLHIARQDRAIDMELTREIIHVRAVRSQVEDGDIGYIRITQFSQHAADELAKAINDLQEHIPADRLKGFILDLRNNPGGLLDQAIAISNDFLGRGEIVSVRGRNPDDAQRFDAKANPGDLSKGKPLIVLINGGSASASEIVAGALQDQRRATILGTRSFGKGSVQTIIPLGSGNGALRLTTARYFTPSGRSIQALGISPDIEVVQPVPASVAETGEGFSEAGLRGHLAAQGAEQKGSPSYVPTNPADDKALHVAIDLLHGTAVNPSFPPNPNVAARK
jgi:carboxyl-terminal processing protease